MRVKSKKTYIILAIVLVCIAMLFVESIRLFDKRAEMMTEEGGITTNNPIMWADVPDPDVIRVGNDYYMVSTSMHMMPGSPIMQSTDLVNWEIIGYPYERLEDNVEHNLRNGMNIYGEGSWANSFKYHNGKFYVLTASLDSGKTYLFSTENPSGDWERTEFNEYLHDPALLFDDNDKAYIIYGIENFNIKELTSDYKAINLSGLNKQIVTSGQEGMEGAHAYKIDGKYYITAIWWEKGGIRQQYVYRSDNINGPYEGKLVLSDTTGYKNNGVAQGGLVDTPDGSWYAMLFQDHDAVGRVPVLVPVRWKDDWPVYGNEEGKVPLSLNTTASSNFVTELTKSDEFNQINQAIDLTDLLASEVPSSTQSMGVELVANGQFNSNIADWIGKDQAKIEVIIDPSSSDNNIAYVSNRTATYAGIEQNFTGKLNEGQRYKASFRIKFTEGPESKEFLLTAKKVNSGETSYEKLISGTVKKNEWTEISGTFSVSDDPEFIYLFVETPWVAKPEVERDMIDFYVDDISIKRGPVTAFEAAESMPNGSKLGLQWQWNHNPNNMKWSLTERQGFLRLTTDNVVSNILEARNTLTQRSQGPHSSGWTSIDTSHMNDGDFAGLAAFQQEYGFVGVTQEAGVQYIVMVDKGVEIDRTPLLQKQVYLKIDFDFTTDKAQFFYSLNGSQWTIFGQELQMRYTLPHFMGYRFALFNFATENVGGYVDFDYFRFSPVATALKTTTVLSAYLKESHVELSKEKGSSYELSLLLDELPEEQTFQQLRTTIQFPDWLEVVRIVANDHNVPDVEIFYEEVAGGITLQMKTVSETERFYENVDFSKKLVTITFTLKKELVEMMNGEVKVDSMEIVNTAQQNEKIDVSGAVSKLSYAPPAQPVGKDILNGNPLVSHKFGADPYALVYKDRVYLYMTNDVFQYDESGNVKDNTYANINKLSVISSDDLVNWTDHGFVDAAGPDGAAKWATQSWAPAAVHKVIDGKDKFFIYFANNASNIGVLMSDSPTGPWIDPIGRPLITRETPGVEKVTWLFDPAVLVDDDGKSYIYFGGGIPEGQEEMPNTARVMELGEDMISVVGEAQPIPAPFMFENSGINKVNDKYYYTYCSNFYGGVRPEGSPEAGQIAYMVSNSPMGPWTYQGVILKNPGHFFDVGGNNHHAIFEFNENWYIAYHAQTLSKAMGVPKGYRSTHLNQVSFNEDGMIQEIIADYEGVKQLKSLNPYVRVEAETIGWQAGVNTEQISDNTQGSFSNRVVTDIDNGDWIAVSNVDFGSIGASLFTAAVVNGNVASTIEIRLDSPDGKLIGELSIPATTGLDQYSELQTKIEGAEGVHHLFLVFRGEDNSRLFKLDYWQFHE